VKRLEPPNRSRMAIGLRDSRATAGGVHLARVRVKGSRPCSMLCTAMPVGGSPGWSAP